MTLQSAAQHALNAGPFFYIPVPEPSFDLCSHNPKHQQADTLALGNAHQMVN